MRKVFIFFAIILISSFLIKYYHLQSYITQENLNNIVKSYGIFAPLIFMGIYALATVFFMPGIPFALFSGAFFGPVLGVIYADFGATIGACLAFFLARYFLKDWVEDKIKGTGLENLYNEAEKKGWKIVAFTRLIPLFPFNLLNYFFGITKVKFFDYFWATLIFMLPGCIGYVVFGSSIFDLLSGKISIKFIIGILLIFIMSIIPVIYKRRIKR